MTIASFEDAFRAGGGGCLRECRCGRVFYDTANSWDWNEGELDALDANENATGCSFAIGEILIGGTSYADACDCWHAVASRYVEFFDENAERIAAYYNAERERLQRRLAEVGAAAAAAVEAAAAFDQAGGDEAT